jgi:hypothetical protein
LISKFAALLALVALLAVPALASGHGRHHVGHHRLGVRPAVAACKSERAADPAAFKTKYANKRGRRAGRRCVVAHVRQAARGCRAERKADSSAFRAKYGRGDRHRHAFRRCVRQHEGDPVS